jgi:uncharacterized membrane protein
MSGRIATAPAIAAAAVLSLALWPVQIHRAFGLPAHPLLIHVPVVFIPILGLAVIATALWPRRLERHAPVLAGFAVIANAATLLAVGAGEAFRADRRALGSSPTLDQHAEAGDFLRWLMVILTALLVAALFTRARRIVLAAAAIMAAAAVFWVIRTGHLGAKVAWGERGPGGPPPGLTGR